MRRSKRNHARLEGWHRLETRSLLSVVTTSTGLPSAPIAATAAAAASMAVVPGNLGHILDTQFQSGPFGEVGAQWRQLLVGGPIRVHLVPPNLDVPPPVPLHSTINAGNIERSQFNSFGFSDLGSQLKGVKVHGALTVDVTDETLDPVSAAGRRAGVTAGILGEPANSGDIIQSQFNDSGFGNVGLQMQKVGIRGNFGIHSNQFARRNIGVAGPSPVGATAAASSLQAGRPDASINRGLIRHSQFNDGGFGDIGMQWRQVHVGGSVGIGFERWEVGPRVAPSGSAAPSSASRPTPVAPTSQNATNTGRILSSQFEDGALGDIGFQFSNVDVARNVATSYNTLSIQPKVNDSGPITASGLTLGLTQLLPVAQSATVGPAASPLHTDLSSATSASASTAQAQAPAAAGGSKNLATNSGRVVHSQVADGGFGDIGLQWRNVRIHGSVAAVHNSLSVQPENTNQGLITVDNVHYPSRTVPLPPPRRGRLRALPATPPVVQDDGDPVTTPLPVPTRPFDRTFDINGATNSGTITHSQFSDGGFGDFGLQWLDVGVHNDVRMVHNSLSVQPEGAHLAGVNVSNVSFGDPVFPPGAAERIAALKTDLRPSPFVPARPRSSLAARAAAGPSADQQVGRGPDHVNDKLLSHVQLIDQLNAPIILQWQNLTRHHGLLIVNNIILLNLGAGTGPITLTDVRFPGMPPINTTISAADIASAQKAALGGTQLAALRAGSDGTTGVAQGSAPSAGGRSVTDQATNSGILVHNQFSGGGFGDIGMQWRKVHVAGPVSVVHNTLAVEPSGEDIGPINVTNVVYNSGTLTGGNRPFLHKVIAPPPFYSRLPFFRHDRIVPLPHDPDVVDLATNSGILRGGQFSARGLGHVMLQWRGITVHGPVTVMDNVLSIDTHEHGSGPITISHVTYA